MSHLSPLLCSGTHWTSAQGFLKSKLGLHSRLFCSDFDTLAFASLWNLIPMLHCLYAQ